MDIEEVDKDIKEYYALYENQKGDRDVHGPGPSKHLQFKRDKIQIDLLYLTREVISDLNNATKKTSIIMVLLTIVLVILTILLVFEAFDLNLKEVVQSIYHFIKEAIS